MYIYVSFFKDFKTELKWCRFLADFLIIHPWSLKRESSEPLFSIFYSFVYIIKWFFNIAVKEFISLIQILKKTNEKLTHK